MRLVVELSEGVGLCLNAQYVEDVSPTIVFKTLSFPYFLKELRKLLRGIIKQTNVLQLCWVNNIFGIHWSEPVQAIWGSPCKST